METVTYALNRIGVERPSWKTLIVSASQEVDLPAEKLWSTWAKLESWPDWSAPLHEATRWTGPPGWAPGATFEQTLRLGFPIGRSVASVTVGAAEPGHRASWWHTDGLKSCHVWDFTVVSQARTRVTNTEVFEGLSVGLMKPLIRGHWQRLFEASVAGLARAATRSAQAPA